MDVETNIPTHYSLQIKLLFKISHTLYIHSPLLLHPISDHLPSSKRSMMKEKGELIPVVKEEQQQRQQQEQQLLTKSNSINSSSSNSSSSSRRRHSSSSMEERKSLSCMESTAADEIIVTKTKQEDKTSKEEEVDNDEMGPRERLKRHRREVAGQVWIPDMWGQESFLNEWIDCSSFDASLIRHNIMLARSSLIQEPHIVAPP